MYDLSAVIAGVNANDRPRRDHLEGVVVAGSWNAATATCQVLIGDTYALFSDSGDQPVVVQATIACPAHGHQYAPVGGERVQVSQVGGGWIVSAIEHADDDTQAVPAGETWVGHFSSSGSGQIDAFHKLTNDGHTVGDGKGGAHYGGGGGLTTITTGSGHVVTLDDTAKTVTVTTAGGHTIVADDNTATKGVKIVTSGGLTHHLDDYQGEVDTIASKIGLGNQYSALVSTQAAYRVSDITTLVNNIVGTTMQKMAAALGTTAVTAAIPNAAAWSGVIGATGWVSGLSGILPTIPNGSGTVRIKD